jgi:AraC family transcriptional regulator, positive regulator of tynA and feaB
MLWLAKSSSSGAPFGVWADALASAFVQLEPRKVTDVPFEGTIVRKDVGPVSVARVSATGHRVLRMPSHIARSTEELVFVNLQLLGSARYTQRQHEQICGPGDIAVVDTTQPFEILNAHNFQLFSFVMQKAHLPNGFLDRPRMEFSKTEIGRAFVRTLAGYAELSLNAQQLPEVGTLSGNHIVDLISRAHLFVAPEKPEGNAVPALLLMMLDHIDDNFHDPALSAASLARRFRCSVRYVHALFSTTGSPVGEHISEKRLLFCSRNLLKRQNVRTIAELAYSAGFQDVSYFNRAFKRRFGMTPRELRRSLSNVE